MRYEKNHSEIIKIMENPVKFYDEKKYEKWVDARAFLIDLKEENNDTIFRGHRESTWDLISSFERKVQPQKLSGHIEDLVVRSFKKGIKAYLPDQNINISKFEALTLMQHYGAPTRLVDFTRSPYIAAYFAYEQPSESEYVTIWAVEDGWIINQNMTIYASTADLLKIASVNLPDFKSNDDVDKLIKSNIKGIVPIVPPNMDIRMLAQQSLFLMPTTLNDSFVSLFKEYFKNHEKPTRKYKSPVTRIDVAAKERLNVLIDLELMNLNSRTLYPGLEGFAKSIAWEIDLYEKNGNFSDRLQK